MGGVAEQQPIWPAQWAAGGLTMMMMMRSFCLVNDVVWHDDDEYSDAGID